MEKISSKNARRRFLTGLGFILIAITLSAIFGLYPIVRSFIMSLNSTKAGVTEFVLFKNYTKIFSDTRFSAAFVNTFIYFIFQVPIMLTLALFLASLLNDKTLKFKGFFRTAIFLPCVTSLVAYSILFRSMFDTSGLINTILLNIGLIETPISWLRDAFWAKVTIIFAITWRWTGYNMIFYLAGLQNIDPSIYEAAEIDGANKATQFFKITVPMLKPVILFTSIMSTIGTLQLFDEVVNIFGNSPAYQPTLTLTQLIYNVSFRDIQFEYGAAISYVIVFITAVLSIIQFRVAGDDRA
jgi:lactose/L-arabinose transport system permease protein